MENDDLPECARYINRIINNYTPEKMAELRLPVYELAHDYYSSVGKPDSAYLYCRLLSEAQRLVLEKSTPSKVAAIENNTRINEIELRAEEKRHDDQLLLVIIISSSIILILACAFILLRRTQQSKIALMQSRLDLERSQRGETATRLAMIENNKLLESLMSKIFDLKTDGKLDESTYNELSRNIKLHSNVNQEWLEFKEIFETIHPSFALRLKERYPLLSEGDLKMATYLKILLSAKR